MPYVSPWRNKGPQKVSRVPDIRPGDTVTLHGKRVRVRAVVGALTEDNPVVVWRVVLEPSGATFPVSALDKP